MRRIIKLCLSRLGFAALFVLVELAFVLTLLFRLSSYSVYFLVFLIVVNVISLIAVVNSDENPEYKLTWMGVIVLVPFLGTVMFILFRRPTMSKREIRRLDEVRECVKSRSQGSAFAELGECDSLAAGKAMAIVGIDESAEVYSGTESKYFPFGREMWESLLADLSGAERYIFLEYFIIEDGVMWEAIFSVLKEKAEAGVEVRVIYDDIGCMSTLPKRFDRELSSLGIRCIRFAPVSADVRNMRRNNNRDHRKLCVIDGSIAYTGGVNIADEYIGEKERFGVWKDGGVRLFGDAAEGFARLFLELWSLSNGECEDIEPYLCRTETVGSDGGYYIPFGSGPYPMYKHQAGKRALLDIINQAQRYVYITTPYLIIDFDLTEALRGAAFRGVDVRIITPGIDDKPIVGIMTRGSFPHLVAGGVKIYEYTPGFIHTKAIVSDDLYAVLGTINLDYRSLVHHFEDAVWMYSTPTVLDVREDFLATMKESRRIEKTEARLGLVGWCVRCIIRLFAPLF
ncbi:MAG: cardiolipin synthase [Clostridia bacterium]|nr:cardiolipin synthase [Clostridia bacterium]